MVRRHKSTSRKLSCDLFGSIDDRNLTATIDDRNATVTIGNGRSATIQDTKCCGA